MTPTARSFSPKHNSTTLFPSQAFSTALSPQHQDLGCHKVSCTGKLIPPKTNFLLARKTFFNWMSSQGAATTACSYIQVQNCTVRSCHSEKTRPKGIQTALISRLHDSGRDEKGATAEASVPSLESPRCRALLQDDHWGMYPESISPGKRKAEPGNGRS